jgi:hypothetical protein
MVAWAIIDGWLSYNIWSPWRRPWTFQDCDFLAMPAIQGSMIYIYIYTYIYMCIYIYGHPPHTDTGFVHLTLEPIVRRHVHTLRSSITRQVHPLCLKTVSQATLSKSCSNTGTTCPQTGGGVNEIISCRFYLISPLPFFRSLEVWEAGSIRLSESCYIWSLERPRIENIDFANCLLCFCM